MTKSHSDAELLLAGDPAALKRLVERPLVMLKDNLVPRPWGGRKLVEFKGLDFSQGIQSGPVGESFEIAADDSDPEACRYPSWVVLEDGSHASLPRLLELSGETILGPDFVARYARRFPLLPKLLNIRELLSVQGHPAGNTEVYMIIAADPGATLRLGFNRDMTPAVLNQRLQTGRAEQAKLVDMLRPDMDLTLLQDTLAPALASRAMDASALAARLAGYGEPRGSTARIADSLEILNGTYWWMLDAMNEIPVAPGQVIHNRNPARLLAAGDEPSSEVHALGNPEAREILALEIRKPGPTFRAWDNVRFPVRQVDIAAAVEALNLRATQPAEFSVTPQPIQGRPGVFLSVASDDFRIEQLRPRQDQEIVLEQQGVHCLHGIAGRIELLGAAGDALGYIGAGESLLIPAPMGGYRLVADAMDNHIVKINLPR